MNRAEREMIGRARHAFTRLVGLELGDKLADELYEARVKKQAKALPKPHPSDASDTAPR